MNKLMQVPFCPTDADLIRLPRIVAVAIVNYNRAFSYYSKHQKMFGFYKAINGTGMKPEDEIAMREAAVKRNQAESEMWQAYDEKQNAIRAFDADPEKFWQDEHESDCDAVIEGLHYVDKCAEMRYGL